MIEKNQVYKCGICGNMVEVLVVGGGQLVCCGQPMTLLVENTVEASKEKHVPVVQQGKVGVKITVGSVPHPMEEKHYIQWIEVVNGDYVNRKYLKPGQAPEAEFYVPYTDKLIVRAYCNLHGLWRA